MLKDLESIFDLTQEELSAPAHHPKNLMLIWFFDEWLPACCGNDAFYGPTTRYYNRATKGFLVGSVRAQYVSAEDEAMGRIILENCEPKWKLIIPEKAKDSQWKLPPYKKDDKRTHKWHETKWSRSDSGAKQHGGWAREAVTRFQKQVKAVLDFRKADRKEGGYDSGQPKHFWYDHGLKLMREKHQITDLVYQVTRKRKAKNIIAPRKLDYKVELEVDDEFSVGSETSAGC